MKRSLITLTAILILASCQNESNVAPKIIKRDTVNTIIGAVGYQRKGYWFGEAKKITADSLVVVSAKLVADTMDTEKKWKKVTYYLVYMPLTVDSALSVQFKLPRYDTTGKPYVVSFPFHFEPKHVVDGITDIDSAKRYLDKYLVKDSSTIKK